LPRADAFFAQKLHALAAYFHREGVLLEETHNASYVVRNRFVIAWGD
jgi:hypothetical protein